MGSGRQDRTLAELERLRAAVLADGRLAASLFEVWRPEAFAARAAEAAREGGLRLDSSEIVALLASRRWPVLPAPPPGWLPAAIAGENAEAVVRWTHFGARRLTEPFYEQSLQGVAPLPFNRLFGFATPLATLTPPPGALEPAGFIFHMSRCGSTLAAQMLAASDANIVVSEAAAIDQVVRSGNRLDERAQIARLRAIVGAFGQVRAGGEQRLFVKLDSWHACALPLFRRAFPATPWVFLYRDPAEVLVSHLRRRGMQMTPELVSPAFLGIDWRGEAPDEDYAARVLAAICEAAAAQMDEAGMAVSYAELPEAIWTRVLPHFGARPTVDEAQAMAAAGARDTKDPARAFEPDSAAKQAEASGAIRRSSQRLTGVYAALEAASRRDRA